MELCRETIITQHPLNKKGIRIDRDVYLAVATLIIRQIADKDEVSLATLMRTAEEQLGTYPDVVQLVYHVKLDLEAKGCIRQKTSAVASRLNVLRLTQKGRRHTKMPALLLEQ